MRKMFSMSPGGNNKKIFKSIKQASARVRRGINKAMRIEKPELIDEVQKDMEQTKHGRTYTVYWSPTGRRLKRGRRHVASTPTETPGIVSGRLKRSIGARIQASKNMVFGAGTNYAKYLEKSGRTYLWKILKKRRLRILTTLSDEIKKELKKGARS